MTAVIPSASSPVSVAFGKDHLYVLGTTTVESHPITGGRVESASDGLAALAVGDGSAAQVGVVDDALVITEKSNVVETVGLRSGAIIGAVTPVGLPSGSDTPFGLVTRGANAYVTIAHSDEVALIRGEQVVAAALTGTPGGSGQHSPCWVAIAGPYLFTSNSPSRSVSRLVATGATILLDDPVAAQTVGAPIDIAVVDKRLAVLDTDAGVTRVTQFTVGDDGALTPVAVSTIQASANGVGIVRN